MMKAMSIQLPIHRIAPHTSTFLCVNSFLPFLKFLRKVEHCLNFDIQVFISIVKFHSVYYLGPNIKVSNPVLNWINKVFSLRKNAILLPHIQMIRYSKLDDMWFLGQWKLFLRINMFIGKWDAFIVHISKP